MSHGHREASNLVSYIVSCSLDASPKPAYQLARREEERLFAPWPRLMDVSPREGVGSREFGV
ncbi:hypothetical protein CH063_13413 [Colletotrichum higginsianum]|uniref:Uncharacterized protein n=1 Tax=Colletotrichum higginsianum (strain IMI 349063) TaxID=759273 RepID=H1VUA6_COLHI|nr:hypothetical protein CH063_13413 [Colletotrichum higginsianum]